MSLAKIRNELEETIRQSRAMADAVNDALTVLLDDSTDLDARRAEISRHIIVGLQAQDRLEQRCTNIERVLDYMANAQSLSLEEDNALWSTLSLDELANPNVTGKSAEEHAGEVELF